MVSLRRVPACLGLVLVLAARCAFAGETNDLLIARQALRDGLFEVARAHAEPLNTDAARIVLLESYALENRWADVKNALEHWKASTNVSAFAYYRAVVDGRLDEAVRILSRGGSACGRADARMLEADLEIRRNRRPAAEKLWREVLALTNASVCARAYASVNLGEVGFLRVMQEETKDVAPLRRLVSLRLGRILLDREETLEEGAKLIRAVVKENPDSPGACEAFASFAARRVAAKNWVEAERLYRELLEIWPDAVRDAAVQRGRGETLLGLNRCEEALVCFEQSEKLSTAEEPKALALLRQGETLTTMNRLDEALVRYRRILAECPKAPQMQDLQRVLDLRERESKGRDLYKSYHFEEARAAFAEVAKADPARRPRMEVYEVYCLYGLGRDDEAFRLAEKLAVSSPEPQLCAALSLWIAKFVYNRGEWTRASKLFHSFALAEPQHAEAISALLWSARASFAANDFQQAIKTATQLVESHPTSGQVLPALLVEGEALIELARFDEAVLVLDRVAEDSRADKAQRYKANALKADALFALGADNPARYQSALDAYRALVATGGDDPDEQLKIAFKIGRVLEKLKRREEAVDQYYSRVLLAYREGRLRGERFGDEARAAFSRAAFCLADDFESRGRDRQAVNVLKLVVESDVPAADEAARRIERISEKGRFL